MESQRNTVKSTFPSQKIEDSTVQRRGENATLKRKLAAMEDDVDMMLLVEGAKKLDLRQSDLGDRMWDRILELPWKGQWA